MTRSERQASAAKKPSSETRGVRNVLALYSSENAVEPCQVVGCAFLTGDDREVRQGDVIGVFRRGCTLPYRPS